MDEQEWIPVIDGAQPTYQVGEVMEVLFPDGEIVRATNPKGLRWGKWGADTITAYRIVPPSRPRIHP